MGAGFAILRTKRITDINKAFNHNLRVNKEFSRHADHTKTDEAEIITMISKAEWFVIRAKEKRAQVLNVAENEPFKIRSFILGIVADNSKNE